MNILQIARDGVDITPDCGGLEAYIYNLSKNLGSLGHIVTVIGRRTSKTDHNEQEFCGFRLVNLTVWGIPDRFIEHLPSPVSVFFRELNQISYSLRVILYLVRNINEYDILAFHLPLIGSILAFFMPNSRKKMVYTSHLNIWGFKTEEIKGVWKFTLLLESWLMRRVGKVFAWSEDLKTRFIAQSKVEPNHIFVIPGGIDLNQFNQHTEINSFKQQWGLNGKFTILVVSRLSKIKGIEYLLKALNIIVKQWGYKDTILFVVGPKSLPSTGNDKPVDMFSINNYLKNNGLDQNIVFTGAISKDILLKFYLACDIFVSPSLAELFPSVVLEALASGKPVVATDVGATAIQVRDGWNGFLVKPADEMMLAEKIKTLIEDPVKRIGMGKNSRKHIEDNFDWCEVAKRISLAYEWRTK